MLSNKTVLDFIFILLLQSYKLIATYIYSSDDNFEKFSKVINILFCKHVLKSQFFFFFKASNEFQKRFHQFEKLVDYRMRDLTAIPRRAKLNFVKN